MLQSLMATAAEPGASRTGQRNEADSYSSGTNGERETVGGARVTKPAATATGLGTRETAG